MAAKVLGVVLLAGLTGALPAVVIQQQQKKAKLTLEEKEVPKHEHVWSVWSLEMHRELLKSELRQFRNCTTCQLIEGRRINVQ